MALSPTWSSPRSLVERKRPPLHSPTVTVVVAILCALYSRACGFQALPKESLGFGCDFPMMLPIGNDAAGKSGTCNPAKVGGASALLTAELNMEASFSHFAAAMLAWEHIAKGDGSVVKELAFESMRQCVLPTDDPLSSEESVMDLFPAFPTVEEYLQHDHPLTRYVEACESLLPCVAFGRMDVPNMDAYPQITTQIAGVPLIAWASTLPRLTRFSFLVRQDVHMEVAVQVLVEYLRQSGRTYISMIHDATEYGTMYAQILEQQVQGRGGRFLRINTVSTNVRKLPIAGAATFGDRRQSGDHHKGKGQPSHPWQDGTPESEFPTERRDIRGALKQIYDSGDHVIVMAISSLRIMQMVAVVADEMGLIGPNYFWILADIPIYDDYSSEELCPHLDRLLTGAGMIQTLDGFAHKMEKDAFLRAWRSKDEAFLRRVSKRFLANRPEISSSTDDNHTACPQRWHSKDYFATSLPSRYSSFVYDSIVVAILAACRLSNQGLVPALDSGTWPSNFDDFAKHFLEFPFELVNTSFHGASGHVHFDEHYSRPLDGVVFGLYNVRPTQGDFEIVLTDVRDTDKGWHPVTNRNGSSFVYFNGSTISPSADRTVRKERFLSSWARVFGLSLMGLSLLFSVGSMIWVHSMRKHTSVRAAQPQFLHLLCIGAAMCVLPILPMSFDENVTSNESILNFACVSSPWLFFVGYMLGYMAMFSKLWRIERIVRMEPREISMIQVLAPFAIVMFLAVTMLSLYTVLDPETWERIEVSHIPYETIGECHGRNEPILFSLSIIMWSATGMAALMAWRTKNISPSHLCESDWIFYAICLQMQAWVVYVPLLQMLSNQHLDASFVVHALVKFTVATSMVVFIIGPKVWSLSWQSSTRNQTRWNFRANGVSLEDATND